MQILADTCKDLCKTGSNTTIRSNAQCFHNPVTMQMMHLVEGEAELILDDLGAGEDGDVLQIARLALTKAGSLHCNHLRTTSHNHKGVCSRKFIVEEGSDLNQCAPVKAEQGQRRVFFADAAVALMPPCDMR